MWDKKVIITYMRIYFQCGCYKPEITMVIMHILNSLLLVLATCGDDLELIQPLDLGSLFHLKQLHMHNVFELQGQLRLNLSPKLIWCVIEHNSLGTGSTFTNQCTP